MNDPAAPPTSPAPPVVTLRRATPADAERILTWRAEPTAAIYQPLRPMTLPRLRAMLAEEQSVIGPWTEGRLRWIVEADDIPVGTIRLDIESREHGIGTIGYGIGEAHRGHGHAAAALRALLPLAFRPDAVDLGRLEAVAALANTASRRTLERAGFRQEGVARGLLIIHGARVDHASYALLRTDWRP